MPVVHFRGEPVLGLPAQPPRSRAAGAGPFRLAVQHRSSEQPVCACKGFEKAAAVVKGSGWRKRLNRAAQLRPQDLLATATTKNATSGIAIGATGNLRQSNHEACRIGSLTQQRNSQQSKNTPNRLLHQIIAPESPSPHPPLNRFNRPRAEKDMVHVAKSDPSSSGVAINAISLEIENRGHTRSAGIAIQVMVAVGALSVRK